ncbi:MAG: hypothetical protein VKP62_03340 [Candidatus Sericytochromatia bacterium]|nr:hypothetical protein [Candidatus Sericytochromatia bacterium]
MDSYHKENPKSEKSKPGGTGRLSPESAGLDTFQSSRTAPLQRLSGTRRLASGSLDPVQLTAQVQTEVENGDLLLGKLEPRLRVLQRAVDILQRPQEASRLCQGISSGEAGFTQQVATMLGREPNALRQVQVALYQWNQAKQGLETLKQALEGALSYPEVARGRYLEEHCQLEKLRGQFFPLTNLHVVFKDNPLLAQLIPAPKAAADPSTGSPAARPATGSLPDIGSARFPKAQSAPLSQAGVQAEVSAADAAVQEAFAGIKQATGNLKDALLGFLGGKPKNPPPRS